jgi:soluble lytic murein transglycosylase-like protein
VNITPGQLVEQLNAVVKNGWLPWFMQAAQKYGFPPPMLLAIGSRETNLTNIKGDFRNGVWHGYGIMQVDIGTDPVFCAQWTPAQVQESITLGASILSDKRATLAANSIRDPRAIAAAYNTGAWNVIRSLAAGRDADATTTGRDYGADVMERATAFTALLIAPVGQGLASEQPGKVEMSAANQVPTPSKLSNS